MPQEPRHARLANLSATKRDLLAQWLEGKARPTEADEPRRRDPALAELPLSFAQERMWFLHQLDPASPLYNAPMSIWLRSGINIESLTQSIDAIVQRHEVLRTTFELRPGGPVQVIAPELRIQIPVHDFSSLERDQQLAELERFARAEVHRPFDLARGPLLRATLVQLGAQELVLLIVMHHIVADGWSMGVFHRELSEFYRSFVAGIPRQLETLAIQYADYAVWQRELLRCEILASQLEYWRHQLDGAPALLELPGDYARPPVQGVAGASQTLVLKPDLSVALQELGRTQHATLFMTLLTAFNVLLYRLSGQADIVVGTPIAGRSRRNTENLIGCFLNTLALRTQLRSGMCFLDVLRAVHETAIGAFAHADLPFEKLLEALQPQRSPAWTPVFQVFFNMLNYAEPRLDLPGATLAAAADGEPAPALARFDLTLYAESLDAGLHLKAVYRTDLFSHARIHELLAQYALLLRQIVADPRRDLKCYSLVTRAARAVLPDPRRPLEARACRPFDELIARHTLRDGERIAVVDAAERLTYRELEVQSNQLARLLQRHSVGTGDVVALYGPRSAAHVVALLGVLKAGAAFVILDPAHPAAYVIACLRLAQPAAWLDLAADLPPQLAAFLDEQTWKARLTLPCGAESGERLDLVRLPDSLAYLAFTSGTTGTPRVVEGTCAPLSHFLDWHTATFGFERSDCFSLLSGLSHDPLLRDVLTPLSLGATLCIPSPEELGSPLRLVDWVRRNRISVVHLTPAMGTILLEGATALGEPGPALPSLRYLFFGGDVLGHDLVAGLGEQAPHAGIVSFYGTTETPQAMAWTVVDGGTTQAAALGRGIEGVQLIVQSSPGVQAGIGELGEIYVRSPYLSAGYRGADELNARHYVPNPFRGAADDRMFRTGDLGRYAADGSAIFVGRADEQVKIRGFRVDCGDVAAVLLEHPAVAQAVVVAEPMESGHRLIAYLVARNGSVVVEGDVRRFVRQRLPGYMVPGAAVLLEQLPLTANGKIDRRALQAIDAAPRGEAPYAPPRTETEQTLARIWAEVLRLEQVGIEGNFFELGGHSLAAMRVLTAIMTQLEIELPLRQIFESLTVADLARVVEQARARGAQPAEVIQRLPRDQYRVPAATIGSDQ